MKRLLLTLLLFAGCSPIMAQYSLPDQKTIKAEMSFIKSNYQAVIKSKSSLGVVSVKIWIEEQEQILMVEYEGQEITQVQFRTLDDYLIKMSASVK
jgi:Holliday junction resolvasome RuvABC endonuclease subunit